MYNLGTFLHYVYRGIPILLVLILFIQILRKQNPIKIRERVRRCIKALPLILIVTLVGGGVAAGYQLVSADMHTSCKIGFTYPTASKGLTPNKTKLDVDEILSDEVLEAAIENGGLTGLETYELKEALKLRNVWQKNSVTAENYYISTEYMLNYQATKATQGFGGTAILKAVYEAYYNYFLEKYGRKVNVISDDLSGLEELDYLDIHTYLSRRVNNIIDYMNLCQNENASFVSGKTQESFQSVSAKATNLRDVSLERYEAYVLRNGLSKDKESYISRLNYNNQMLNVKYMKNLATYNVRLEAIKKYAGDITTAVLVPSRDKDGEFYQSRTKIGTDYFAYDADRYLDYATDRQSEIQQNNYRIEMLSAERGGQSAEKHAETMIASLKKEITELGQLAVQTVQDYDDQVMNDYVSVSYADETNKLVSLVKAAVKYAFVLFVLASLIAFAGEKIKLGKKWG